MSEPEHGDYVLATKYHDGDPGDQWSVGFYDRCERVEPHYERHYVTDGEGRQFRGNGFRRVSKISAERGAWLLSHTQDIEWSVRSLWWWKRASMTTQKMDPSPPKRAGAKPLRATGEKR